MMTMMGSDVVRMILSVWWVRCQSLLWGTFCENLVLESRYLKEQVPSFELSGSVVPWRMLSRICAPTEEPAPRQRNGSQEMERPPNASEDKELLHF